MALTLSESAKQERKLPEAGATVGMLYSLVDLGTQKTNWDNEEKWSPKVRLTFELPDQTDEFEVVENGKTTKVSPLAILSISFCSPKSSIISSGSISANLLAKSGSSFNQVLYCVLPTPEANDQVFVTCLRCHAVSQINIKTNKEPDDESQAQ